MHGGGVNKLEMNVQKLMLFHGVNLVLLIETWHFPSQQLPHIEGCHALTIMHTMQLGKNKSDKT
jgi:hypothetical protein